MTSIADLRAYAVGRTLFEPTTLADAIARLGFVQADPIRAPARAQDLILRHRVKGYRAGDLEAKYASLEVEEDLLYAYGFLPRAVWKLLHPRKVRKPNAFEKRVLDVVRERGVVHPRDLESELGKKRVVNAWGGFSKKTTHALDRMQLYGHLRIAKRDSGIRMYALAPEHEEDRSPKERVRDIALVVAGLLAPVRKKTLQAITARSARWLGVARPNVRDLGLESSSIAGEEWLWPKGKVSENENDSVRILAPFDPIVWDRARFETLWGWAYRFEAYTPIEKRVRGYYAMPLVWRDAVIGWVNASVEKGKLDVDVGFEKKKPRDRDFKRELDIEIDRFRTFLGLM